ncbi:uncharacterized protein LOC143605633 [Bidens hawaiensis]|uniref:uncharacterized protein LOC143599179 n=1 Tax=Bidens hawaiensis TaxID=980011 RepID=UPI00404B867A
MTMMSLGIEVRGKVFDIVIPRNTHIPTIRIDVYQGERTKSTMNHLLGSFTAYGIPPAPKSDMKVEICFEIDLDGILTVTSKIISNGIQTHDCKQ